MQRDPTEPGVDAGLASRPKLSASTDEIADEKNKPLGPLFRLDSNAPAHQIPGANERP
jgi:hypothetical protein